jgi:hypothetical protein
MFAKVMLMARLQLPDSLSVSASRKKHRAASHRRIGERSSICSSRIPTLLDAMDATHAVRLFRAFRIGAMDKALNVFGTWADRQADMSCALANQRSFDDATRVALATMAITQQLPQQAASLQQGFLQTPDGRCSLPVAYTLSYSQLGLGTLKTRVRLLPRSMSSWLKSALFAEAEQAKRAAGHLGRCDRRALKATPDGVTFSETGFFSKWRHETLQPALGSRPEEMAGYGSERSRGEKAAIETVLARIAILGISVSR